MAGAYSFTLPQAAGGLVRYVMPGGDDMPWYSLCMNTPSSPNRPQN